MLLAALLPEALPLQAQEQQQQTPVQEGRQRHVVRTGDTLWDLAQFYLTDPFLWPEIYRLNTMVIEDPHWIYPDEVLVVPGARDITGEPIPGEEDVVVRPPEGEPGEIITLPPPDQQTIFAAKELTRQTLTYQREPPTPPVAVSEYDFNRSGMLIPLDELAPSGRVVDPAVPGAGVRLAGDYVNITRYEGVYISHPGGEAPDLAERMLIYRIEREIPGYGHVIIPTGVLTVVDVHEDVSIAIVTELYDAIDAGQYVTPVEPFDTRPGVLPEPVATGPSAELVALQNKGQIVPSIEDIVFIDIGQNQGVEIGDEFEIFVPERESKGGLTLPGVPVARARAVRTTEETTTLRVVQQTFAAIQLGLPVRLVAKMPQL